MEKQRERLTAEMETIKRIIDGYLSTDPILSAFELDSFSIKPKNKAIDSTGTVELKSNIVHEMTDEKIHSGILRELCCVRPNRTTYHKTGWHCDPGDKECGEE
jgi:hypothetical protein